MSTQKTPSKGMRLNQHGIAAIAAVIAVTLIAAVVFTVWRVQEAGNSVSNNATNESSDSTLTDDQHGGAEGMDGAGATNEDDEARSNLGTLRGSLTYPSSSIPDSVIVCAVNIKSKEETCTDKRLKGDEFVYGAGFEIEVAPGSYELLAKNGAASLSDARAYYDEYIRATVLDGDTKDPCTDRDLVEPLIIDLAEGETINGLVAGDWYYPANLVNCDS